jgi:Flp pilus assembly protein CpaB
MSRRARAAAFAGAAALCAGLAAAATGATPDAGLEYGALRDVVVAAEPLPAHRRLRVEAVRKTLELRRVPERFAPPDALSNPAQAVGRSPSIPIPAGGYVVGSQLAAPSSDERGPRELAAGRVPVEIAVEAAGTLAGRTGKRVDVVVTTEPAATGPGRTYVAAPAVTLLELRSAAGEPGAGDVGAATVADTWIATLAVTRGQALRLIQAQSFARSIRLIER